MVVEQFCDQHMFPAHRKRSSTSSTSSIHDDTVQEFAALLRDRLQKNLSYPDLGRILYGRTGAILVNTFLLITQFGFCMNYYIFVGNILYSFLPPINDDSGLHNMTTFGPPTATSTIEMNYSTTFINNITTENSNYFADINNKLDSSQLINDTVSLNSDLPLVATNSMLNLTSTTIFPTTTMPIIQNNSLSKSEKNVTNMTDLEGTVPNSKVQRKGPSLAMMVLMPTPLLIAFTLFRDIRRMGPISAVANLSVICGSLSVLVYILTGKNILESISLTILLRISSKLR